ncbi:MULTISPECIES: TetR/AcrR family transcriptional regulator [Microbacterium]|uniref:TetR/AcrR family transcriptional regulator n=1 Tax=Microbacterium wangchenii TaxID=2541726 RepID=A0ABX5SNY4_9MICO|nr:MULTISPECIES: TetR/AcrR family transcriptional regulator [Microbacterium]MCK6068013.1 TetR/AcrR family transcriptional regulator [Microbacterium sp. EYE_512]QBR87848.1 TetR/AcrR family transcriptional regulator [Microbacterium wangchenii]TXK16142.1 TetR/AcrR family transcriptional regulator [Microbacterium wangchenii]
MPTPERTSLEEIVAAARELLETGGPTRVTMQAVAARVGVRAPSLYKRVRDRDALLTLVASASADDLSRRLTASDRSLHALALAYRAFATEHPEGFRLFLTPMAAGPAVDAVGEAVVRAAAGAVGEQHALEAARLVTAWATGFLTMELAGAFRMGGDLDAAFAYGLDRILAGLGTVPDQAQGS